MKRRAEFDEPTRSGVPRRAPRRRRCSPRRRREVLDRRHNPNQNITTRYDGETKEVVLKSSRYGHYVASGEINTKAEQLGQDDFIPWKRGISL